MLITKRFILEYWTTGYISWICFIEGFRALRLFIRRALGAALLRCVLLAARLGFLRLRIARPLVAAIWMGILLSGVPTGELSVKRTGLSSVSIGLSLTGPSGWDLAVLSLGNFILEKFHFQLNWLKIWMDLFFFVFPNELCDSFLNSRIKLSNSDYFD